MISALEETGENRGAFQTWEGKGFANIVYVSFSAFDGFFDIEDDIVQYSYIGLATKMELKILIC